MGGLAAILSALSLLSASPVGGAARVDCRYSSDEETTSSATVEQSGGLNPTFLPQNDVFRPILAVQREPRFYADYRRVNFRGESLLAEGNGNDINAALVALGGEFGLWGLRQARGCEGLQISLFGAVFSQFNLDTPSFDLLNAAFLVGLALTYRRGPWSGRLRTYHQSSHLGDKFLLNYGLAHGVGPQHPSFGVLDLLGSLEGKWWRLYGGGGLVVFSKEPDLSSTPLFVEYGFELRGPAWVRLANSSLRPV